MSNRQQTQSKMAREREVKERRARKLEKKYAASAERKATAESATFPTDEETYAGQPGQARDLRPDPR